MPRIEMEKSFILLRLGHRTKGFMRSRMLITEIAFAGTFLFDLSKENIVLEEFVLEVPTALGVSAVALVKVTNGRATTTVITNIAHLKA